MVKYEVELTQEEKEHALVEIKKRCIKGLYVYEQTEKDKAYNYKNFIYNLITFVQTSDQLFGGELAQIVINLQSILNNDFEKKEFRRIILENKNIVDYKIKTLQEDIGDSNGKNR